MFNIEEHTADIRIRLVAPTAEELFADAVRALMSVMKPERAAAGPVERVGVAAPDHTALLVDFLNEILLLCHTRRRAYEPESVELGAGVVVATLRASAVAGFEEDVKAVTYHEADVRRSGDGWSTTLVLDV